MVLSSSQYFVFLFAIFFVYWPLARVRRLGLAVLLFGNYFFYAKWDTFYLALIPTASMVDYLVGLGLDRSQSNPVRRMLLGISVLMNVGLLATLKYTPFLLSNLSQWTGQPAPEWHWTFPVGLSFYCFQALTYTIDIYRRDAKATDSLLAHLTAVSFFPTTLAGPITRVSSLLSQFAKKELVLSPADGSRGLFLIGMGLMKKLMIADFLAENLVNRVFDTPKLYTGWEVLVAVYGYAIQLYYDFSGYTDIALGSALLLGLKLPINFNQPYLAENIADFWRRWHISLSNWLRDYLYFSLPGKRNKLMIHLNLVVTMVIGGLWHGPSWNFVIWGALHGVALAATRAVQTWRGNRKPMAHPAAKSLRVFVTVQFVVFAWIFFRANDLDTAMAILQQIGSLTFSTANISREFTMVLVIGILAHYTPKNWYQRFSDLYIRSPFYVQAVSMMLLVLALRYVATTGAAPFIYTKF